MWLLQINNVLFSSYCADYIEFVEDVDALRTLVTLSWSVFVHVRILLIGKVVTTQ